ncbi:MAG: hypothetical protein M3547_09260 [Acidobacteriota bacterium]|nr:hypothetical protein [Acidobacteriota bacterium]
MPWSRFDDQFHDHGKILTFSHRAFRLYVCSITYSTAHHSRGHLTRAQAEALARQQGVGLPTIQELTEKKGWDLNGDGYAIHDYEKYHPLDVTAADRMRRFRQRVGDERVTKKLRKKK